MSYAGVGHGKFRVCHCWDCKSAPSELQGKWKKAKNRKSRRSAKTEVRNALREAREQVSVYITLNTQDGQRGTRWVEHILPDEAP